MLHHLLFCENTLMFLVYLELSILLLKVNKNNYLEIIILRFLILSIQYFLDNVRVIDYMMMIIIIITIISSH